MRSAWRGHGPGPFERHLLEAIELNRRRAPLYAQASGGTSLKISTALIRRERLLLPLARWFDWRASSYVRAGVPVMEDLFVHMDQVPALVTHMPSAPPRLQPPRSRPVVRALRRAFSAGGFSAAGAETERQLGALQQDPGYWCMLRHLLESMRRLCACAEIHAELAQRADLDPPEPIHRALWRLHLLGIGSAVRLDRLAVPVQRGGVPILCRDVPEIPAYGSVRVNG